MNKARLRGALPWLVFFPAKTLSWGYMEILLPYTIFSCGDRALTIDFGNRLDDEVYEQVMHLYSCLTSAPIPAVEDLVPAYASLTVYYDPLKLLTTSNNGSTAFEALHRILLHRITQYHPQIKEQGRTIEIPVCYEGDLAPDLDAVAAATGLDAATLIALHSSHTYRVYMMGFLPGFAYMGSLHERLQLPRKSNPQPVVAGAVGIAGVQTGIYPSPSPGGWHIIGRTPVILFNADEPHPCLLQPGDTIKFYPISQHEYNSYPTGTA